jgi:hypothetical protein
MLVLNGFHTMSGLFNTNSRMSDSSVAVFSYTFSSERTIRYKGCPANYILYNPANFSQENFCNFIINNFSFNTTYSITVKIRFRVDTYFYMCESNIPLMILSKHDINKYIDQYEKFVNSIKEIMNSYWFSGKNNTYQNTNIPFNRLNGILILYSDTRSITDLKNKLDENK